MFSSRKTAAPSGSYSVGKSLRLRSSASAYLNRTPSVTGNRQTWTWSGWVKLGQLGTNKGLFVGRTSASTTYTITTIINTDNLAFYDNGGATLVTTQVFRDPSAWYHIVYAVDTTQATSTNRIKIYVNGSQVTSFSTATYPTQNATLNVNTTATQTIGDNAGASQYYDGYMAEVNFVDGQQLAASSFGTYDINGVWQPAKYSGSYGTNGFYLTFGNTTSTATLGNDSSGNSNTWTVNNISLTAGSTYDSMLDSPTVTSTTVANYCVLNPIAPNPSTTASTITDGNLTASASAANTMRKGTFGINSGAFYFEATLGSTVQGLGLGEVNVNSFGTNSAVVGARTYYLYNSSTIYSILPGADTGITSGIASGGTLAVAVNYSTLKLWLGYAASGGGSITWVGGGNPASGTTPTYTLDANTQTLYPLALTNGPSLFVNFGQRPFTYTPPTGFNALNTYNLPTPTIANGAQYFAASTYAGNLTGQTITNGGNNTIGTTFQPDLVWVKSRSAATDHKLTDAVRGATKALISDTTGTETTDVTGLTAFASNGFTLGASTVYNNTGATYAAWQWLANGAGSSNTNGSITSTVSANTTAGFSVVTYTGTGANGTIGHGLGVAPNMVITKSRNLAGSHWTVYHSSVGNTGALLLDTTATTATSSTYWNNTSPTSSVFSVGIDGSVNNSGNTFVAYCWAAVAGYSAFGSYTGNGSLDGPFLYFGFRPRFIMWKRTDTAGYPWYMMDTSRAPYNQMTAVLYANASDAEANFGGEGQDFVSNGWKVRASSPGSNASGGTYIWAAYAENPFNSSRAR
jgi:hypothetical protein